LGLGSDSRHLTTNKIALFTLFHNGILDDTRFIQFITIVQDLAP